MLSDAIATTIGFFRKTHQLCLSRPYMVSWGKDQKIMKQIVDTYGVDDTMKFIKLFFLSIQQDEFLRNTGASIGVLKSQLPKLLLKLHESVEKEETGKL